MPTPHASADAPSASTPTPPVAPRRAHVREHHGERFEDPYAWMADRQDPQLLSYLEAENAYAAAMTQHVEPLAEQIYTELRGRIVETDMSVAVRHDRWWYYSRTIEGQQYGVEARVAVAEHPERPVLDGENVPAGEQVLLDHNVEAGEHEFFSVGATEVSPSGDLLAWAADVTGDERYDLFVRRIESGELLDSAVRATGGSLAWSLDGAYLFYTRVDDAWRPHQVWRHEVGTPQEQDVLVHDEPDERFFVGVGTSRDDRWVVIAIGSKTTSEMRLLDAADPLGAPRTFAPREQGVEYEVEPAGQDVYVVHNAGRPNFEVAVAPIDATSRADWRALEVTGEDEYVTGIDAFDGHLVVSLRRDGMSELRVVQRDPAAPGGIGEVHDIGWDEPIHTVGIGANPESSTSVVQLSHVSLVSPVAVLEYDLETRERRVIKQQQVRGGHEPDDYVQRLEWATAQDGTRIPISVVHHRDTALDGTAPGFLYGYGAYGIPMDPTFSVLRLSLLQRGWVHATAHVRGGSELGRWWYDEGKMEHKATTFSDFVDCADHLRASAMIDPDRLAAEGGSAGGLLMGAVANQAPDRFRFIHAAVPFVDNLTTVLDPSLPLTVIEWEEWGDPLHDPEAYRLLRSYSPYENVVPQRYPYLLVTTSLHDTRVFVTEPAKWVAALRTALDGIELDGNELDGIELDGNEKAQPVLFRTEMAAGHGGQSGRYRVWRQAAWETAVMLGAVTPEAVATTT